jgi:hypothetical protein
MIVYIIVKITLIKYIAVDIKTMLNLIRNFGNFIIITICKYICYSSKNKFMYCNIAIYLHVFVNI